MIFCWFFATRIRIPKIDTDPDPGVRNDAEPDLHNCCLVWYVFARLIFPYVEQSTGVCQLSEITNKR